MTEPRPAWADSVAAFASASNRSTMVNSAPPIQFPDTGQLGGVCGNLLGGSAMTSGLMAAGDQSQGTAGSLVSGTQFFSDMFCGLMGGTGTDTSPQQIAAAGQDVSAAVNTTPMSAGTIAMGGSTGNTALDAINGLQNLANNLYSILAGCGCAPELSPAGVGPEQIISTSQDTADAVNGSPFAAGIIAMGQDPAGSGNVAVDAINGAQFFANGIFSFLSLCGCGGAGVAPAPTLLPDGLPPGPLVMRVDTNPYSPNNVDPQTILDVTSAIADAVHGNAFAQDFLGGGSGNLAVDALRSGQALVNNVHQAVAGALAGDVTLGQVAAAGGSAINNNNARHVGHQSLTTAQSVSVKDENLLIAQDFAAAYSVVADPSGHWSHDATDGDPATNVLGCLKCVADGTQDDYISNEIPVAVGENIEVAATVKWDSLTYSGASPLVLGIEKYRLMKTGDGNSMYADVGGYTIAAVAAPAASSGGKFVGLAGVYTVEPGVDQIRMRFRVADNATAGTIKWDNGDFLKTDLIADAAVPGVGATVDSIVTQLYGDQGAGFTHNQAAVALANNAAALTSVTSAVAALQAEGHTGAIAGDSFSFSGEIAATANWGGGYGGLAASGYYQGNGADAVWVIQSPGFDLGAAWGRFDWQGSDATSTTDYQVVQAVLDSPPQLHVAGAGAHASYLWLFGRISADWLSYIKLAVGGDGTYQVIRAVGGVETVMNSGSCPVPGMGSIVSLYCGDAPTAAPRHFRVQLGAQIIAEFDEVGTASLVGSLNRKWGWGGQAYRYALFGSPPWVVPPNVDQWLALDQ